MEGDIPGTPAAPHRVSIQDFVGRRARSLIARGIQVNSTTQLSTSVPIEYTRIIRGNTNGYAINSVLQHESDDARRT